MKEKIFNVGFKEFLKSPFSVIFFLAIIGLGWTGRYLIDSKEKEIQNQRERLNDCDEERKIDKQLLQDLIFENKRKQMLEEK